MKNIFISIVILLLANHSFGYYYCVCRSAPDSPDGQHCSKRYCIESPQIYLTPWRSCDILDGLICRCTGVSNTRTCDLCGCRPRTPVIIDRPIYINRTVYIEKPIYINQTICNIPNNTEINNSVIYRYSIKDIHKIFENLINIYFMPAGALSNNYEQIYNISLALQGVAKIFNFTSCGIQNLQFNGPINSENLINYCAISAIPQELCLKMIPLESNRTQYHLVNNIEYLLIKIINIAPSLEYNYNIYCFNRSANYSYINNITHIVEIPIEHIIYINQTIIDPVIKVINQTVEIPVDRIIYVNNTDTNLTYETFNSQNEIIKITMLSFIGLFIGSSILVLSYCIYKKNNIYRNIEQL